VRGNPRGLCCLRDDLQCRGDTECHHDDHRDDDDPEEHAEDAPEEDGAGGALLELPAVGVDDEGHHETDESQDQSQQERYQADVGDGPGAAGGLGCVAGAAVGGGCSGEPGPAASAEGIGIAHEGTAFGAIPGIPMGSRC